MTFVPASIPVVDASGKVTVAAPALKVVAPVEKRPGPSSFTSVKSSTVVLRLTTGSRL